ncbi:MAG TPA: hypothetical protein VF996_01700 [Candidatus Saccharimonadales bacterium]|jgi:D-alanine-D-alanine ligase
MSKQNVAVVFGSRSTEHDVSVITAISGVINPLKLSESYQSVPVYIAKDGRWYSHPDLAQVEFYRDDLDKKLAKLKPLQLKFDGGLWLVSTGLRASKTKIDIVFPATHGTNGEDGSLMGLCQMAGVPYVGADLVMSAISMDKLASRRVAQAGGVLVPNYIGFSDKEFSKDKKQILKDIGRLKYPLFVKPTHLGSSIAVAQVKNERELLNALEVVFHYDDWAVVEEAVPNLVEVTVPIMGNKEFEIGMVEEYLYKPGEFFDFDSKYLKGGKGKKGGKSSGQGGGRYSRMPAKISKELYKQCQETVERVFYLLGASGYARIDLLIDSKKGLVYFNEVNPMPGSLQSHNWREAGTSPLKLVEKLIELGLERQAGHDKRTTSFDSSFLSQF